MPLSSLSEQDLNALTRNRLAAIVRSSADAIVGETLDGIITDWNPAAERLYGYTAEEVIGRPFMAVIPPERSGETAEILAQVLRGDSVEDVETVRWTKDGRRIEISLTVFPVRNDAGEIVATSAIVRDITARKATERALAASEAILRVAFENAPIGMILGTPDGHMLRVNRALCDMLGYTADALLGNGLWAFTHAEDIAANRILIERALSGELASYEMEKRYIHRDGHVIWGHLSGSLVRDDDGTPRYFISQIQDITERKAADASLAAADQRTRQLLESITDGFFALGRTGRIIDVNPAIERMLGRSQDELLGDTICQESVPVLSVPLYAALTEAMTERRPVSAEGYYAPADCWFEMRAYPSPEGISVFLHDITERKRTDLELQAALDAAQAAHQATRQFLTMMSHELRTPMQAIIGYAELLLAGPKRSLTPEQAEDVQTIRRGANRLVELVKQMLDISRLDAGQLELKIEPVSLAPVVEAVRQDVVPQAAAKRLTLCIDLPADLPEASGDAMGVHQILLNLVGNAVKFTERGEVRISAEATEDEIAVAVTDTGIGIAPETLPHIFEEFRQVDHGMTRRYDGAGLGLTIARRLAERMGGRLSAESQPGVGSTFTLHLPVDPAPSSALATSSTRTPLALV